MKTALQKLGYKIITDHTYLASAAYCVRSAVYVKASSHTVCGLDNGADYKKTLEKAGITAKCSKKSVEEVAQEVIAGKWGNGTERRKRLEAAGHNYSQVQAAVNKICKNT